MNTNSVDPAEVTYYEKLGNMWWDETGILWPLHKLNALRTDYIKSAICEHFQRQIDDAQPLTGLSVLDIGCGGGILSESMARLGATVTGIDVTEKNINVARQHSQEHHLSINYQTITAEELVEQQHQYDVVLNMEVVEHVAELDGFMHACCELIADNGMLFVATINRTFRAWLFAIIGAEYILRWLPKGTHQWRKFVTPNELDQCLSSAQLIVTKRTGVKINPFNRRFHLCKSLLVNYMIVATQNKH